MEKALEELSAFALRNLLIEEVKKFTVALDCGSTEELQGMKHRLRLIFNLIEDKEKEELMPLPWGPKSTNIPGN